MATIVLLAKISSETPHSPQNFVVLHFCHLRSLVDLRVLHIEPHFPRSNFLVSMYDGQSYGAMEIREPSIQEL